MHEPQASGNPGHAPRPLCQLRARLQDDARRNSGASLGEWVRMEIESAMEWDRTSRGRQSYPKDSFEIGKEYAQGNEHRVFQSIDGLRAVKLTANPPTFGSWGKLMPYLDNLVLNNHLHGDDQQVETFLPTPKGVQLVMSQPWIQGCPALEEEISQFMISREFANFGLNVWRSEKTGVIISDARPANIFKETETGMLIPIDVQVRAPRIIVEKAWREQAEREKGSDF